LIIGTGGQPIKGATENSHRFIEKIYKKIYEINNDFQDVFESEIYFSGSLYKWKSLLPGSGEGDHGLLLSQGRYSNVVLYLIMKEIALK
jgi:hypothetical protein